MFHTGLILIFDANNNVHEIGIRVNDPGMEGQFAAQHSENNVCIWSCEAPEVSKISCNRSVTIAANATQNLTYTYIL